MWLPGAPGAGMGGSAAERGLIPRQALFGNPERTSVQLSPDGTKIGFLAPREGVLNIHVGPVDDPAAAQPVTRADRRGIRFFFWAFTNEHVLYIQDKDGDENWRVYAVNVASCEEHDLTPLEGVHAVIHQTSRHFPAEVLVGLNDRDPRLHDVYRVDLLTGRRQLVYENTGYADFVADEQLALRLGVAFNEDASIAVHNLGGVSGPCPLMTIPADDISTTGPIGFTADGRKVYMRDSRGRNTAALTLMDLDSLETTLLAEDERADIDETMVHPTQLHVQAYAVEYLRTEWHALDDAIADDLAYLGSLVDGDFQVPSRTLDDRRWIISYTVDDGPGRYYLYDREAGKAEFLFTSRPALESWPLAKMEPHVVRSRDGLDLVCYLTLPPKPVADPPPLMLWVHGGPWARDSWGYSSVSQWLANRGYAVLMVNYRGSVGLGKTFLNAANREWAAKMHEDLVDAVRWAIGQGVADGQKVAIGGGSYGGYATLVGLALTPDVFACGIDIVGPSNLVTLLNNVPDYWIPLLPAMKERVGDPTTEEGRAFLESRSPLTYVDRIRKPLLIAQGANDPRVKRQESDQIVSAMQARSIPVTYAVYSDEGHGFARPENTISLFAVSELFLANALGGRAEPVGEDFAGSTIEVQAGQEFVPGLPSLRPS